MNCQNCKHWVFNKCTITGSYITADKLCNGWELSVSFDQVQKSNSAPEDITDYSWRKLIDDWKEGLEMSDVVFEQSTYDSNEFEILVCGVAAAYIYRDEDSEEMRFQSETLYDSYLTADNLIEIANKMKEMESSEVQQ